MTWREWAHWSYAHEYNRQLNANNYRVLTVMKMNINRGKNKAAFKAEKVWPLPLIDCNQVDISDSQEHSDLRDFLNRYNTAKNGG